VMQDHITDSASSTKHNHHSRGIISTSKSTISNRPKGPHLTSESHQHFHRRNHSIVTCSGQYSLRTHIHHTQKAGKIINAMEHQYQRIQTTYMLSKTSFQTSSLKYHFFDRKLSSKRHNSNSLISVIDLCLVDLSH
jgi:hypothetical protein